MPEDSDFITPPIGHSSMIQGSQNKKRKCAIPDEDLSIPDLSSNNTDSSVIPNSQSSVLISQCNLVAGTRQRKKRFDT